MAFGRFALQLLVFSFAVLGFLPGESWSQGPSPSEAAKVEFFEKKVRPVLATHCVSCHSAQTKIRGGLSLDERDDLLKGGNTGPAVVPGNPEKSLLIHSVLYTDDMKMPPKKPLSQEQIADLTRWIKEGAVWSRVKEPVAANNLTSR